MIHGKFDEAWKIAQQIQKEHPDDIRALFNRGWFLINQGKFQEGFQHLEYGRALNVYGSERLKTNKPIWNQSDLTGKTVIINLEGGYGDNIISVRFANEIQKRGGTCIVCCDVTLHGLFSRTPGVSKCITWGEVSSTYHDWWIPGFSCSWLFGHTFENLPNDPYIFANDNSVQIWKEFIKSENPKIGIRWSGNPQFEHQQFRIFPAEKLINLCYKNENLQFYSLQRDNDLRELPKSIIDLNHFLISWQDTAAAIQNLDLVITSCTSIAHLSAAMGKPTWIITPVLPYHTWAYGADHSPWYPKTTRIFRQKTFGNWSETFDEIQKELQDLYPNA